MSESKRGVSVQVFVGAIVAAAIIAGGLAYVLTNDKNGGSSDGDTPVPTATPDIKVTIEDLRFIAELATASFRVVAEVQDQRIPDDFRKFLGVKEQVLMLAYADVKAGFDLTELTENSMRIRGTQVELILPPPEILSVTLDHERSHIVYYDKSLLIRYDIEWVEGILEATDTAIRQESVSMGILDKAAESGKLHFENQLRMLGFTDVEVTVKQ